MDGAVKVVKPAKPVGDARYTVSQIRRDHGLLFRLLGKFAAAATIPAQRPQLMRLALDFFEAHSRVEECGLLPAHDVGVLPFLIELQETTPPNSRLYYSRGLDLKRYLESHMREEETYSSSSAECRVPGPLWAYYRRLKAEVQEALHVPAQRSPRGRVNHGQSLLAVAA